MSSSKFLVSSNTMEMIGQEKIPRASDEVKEATVCFNFTKFAVLPDYAEAFIKICEMMIEKGYKPQMGITFSHWNKFKIPIHFNVKGKKVLGFFIKCIDNIMKGIFLIDEENGIRNLRDNKFVKGLRDGSINARTVWFD